MNPNDGKIEEKNFEKIRALHLEIIKDPKAPTQYIKEKEYQILVLRLIDLGAEELVNVSYTYIFIDDKIYRVEKGEVISFFVNDIKSFYEIVDENTEYLWSILSGYIAEVDTLEDKLYDRAIPRYFIDIWFDLKKGISKFERVLKRGGSVLGEFVKANPTLLKDHDSEFKDVINYMDIYAKQCASELNKLDTMHHYFNSIKSDKLNRNIYLLSLVAGVFLPLNLIVGFFGINTENLFFKNNPQGTLFVLYMIICVFFFLIFAPQLLKALDKYLLKYLLGRYDFYKKLTKNIEM